MAEADIPAQEPLSNNPIDPLDTILKEPGECWPRTLRQHIDAISRDNVMVNARDVWRVLDALLPLIERGLADRWQPIETAPRDGKPILAKADMGSYRYTLPFVVFWGNRREESGDMPELPPDSQIERDWLLAGSEDYSLLYEPTHWMPVNAIEDSQS